MRIRQRSFAIIALVALTIGALLSFAQNTNQQSIPDAPSATRPFPKPTVSPTAPPAAPESAPPSEPPPDQNADQNDQQAPAPPANITTVPPGGPTKTTDSNTNTREELYKISTNVNF